MDKIDNFIPHCISDVFTYPLINAGIEVKPCVNGAPLTKARFHNETADFTYTSRLFDEVGIKHTIFQLQIL